MNYIAGRKYAVGSDSPGNMYFGLDISVALLRGKIKYVPFILCTTRAVTRHWSVSCVSSTRSPNDCSLGIEFANAL